MRATVRATPAGTIADLDGREDLVLATDLQDVEPVKEHFGNRPAVQEFDGFFLLIEDGEYQEVYGFRGIVPDLSKPVYRITLTYSKGGGKKTKPSKAKRKSPESPSVRMIRGR